MNAQISITITEYSASLSAYLRTVELDCFLKELLRTHLDLKSTAELQPLEPEIEFSITPCYPNGIKVIGQTKENGVTSPFEFISHHSQLLKLITELEKIMIKYSIKKNITCRSVNYQIKQNSGGISYKRYGNARADAHCRSFAVYKGDGVCVTNPVPLTHQISLIVPGKD